MFIIGIHQGAVYVEISYRAMILTIVLISIQGALLLPAKKLFRVPDFPKDFFSRELKKRGGEEERERRKTA